MVKGWEEKRKGTQQPWISCTSWCCEKKEDKREREGQVSVKIVKTKRQSKRAI